MLGQDQTVDAEQAGRNLAVALVAQTYDNAAALLDFTNPARAQLFREKANLLTTGQVLSGVKVAVPSRSFMKPVSSGLAKARFGNTFRPKFQSRVRMGQYIPADMVASEAQIAPLLQTMPFYDAFVKFTLDTAPSYINPNWKTPFQVNEALKSFERTYSSQQNARQAASWGVRVPLTMRADIAYKRMKLAASQWNNMFLGYFMAIDASGGNPNGIPEGPSGSFNPSDPGAQSAISCLGSNSTVKVDGSEYTILQTLHAPNADGGYPSEDLEFWYLHVYRALQTFVPILAKQLSESCCTATVENPDASVDPASIYSSFAVPNLDNPDAFVLWVISASTFKFYELYGNEPDANLLLRKLLTDSLVTDISNGYKDASAVLDCEQYFYALASKSIAGTIAYLEYWQKILKVLQVPYQLLQKTIDAIAAASDALGSGGGPGLLVIGGIIVGSLIVIGGTILILK